MNINWLSYSVSSLSTSTFYIIFILSEMYPTNDILSRTYDPFLLRNKQGIGELVSLHPCVFHEHIQALLN